MELAIGTAMLQLQLCMSCDGSMIRLSRSELSQHWCTHLAAAACCVLLTSRSSSNCKLSTGWVCTGNMMLFDKDGIIKRYDSPEHILTEFFELRLDYYSRRRLLLIHVRPQGVHALLSALHTGGPGLPCTTSY